MIHRLGLVVNPRAGHGWDTNAPIARQLVDALKPDIVLVGADEMGADALAGWEGTRHILAYAPAQGRARTAVLVQHMIARDVEMIAVVGGDGTMADTAFALFRANASAPILGVGVGSANVGGLVTVLGSQVAQLAGARREPRVLDALVAGVNGEMLGIAFNDVVVSTTVLATVAGELTEVQVIPKQSGENVPGHSEPIWTRATHVQRASPLGKVTIARGDQVGTLICGLSDSRFFGKAIAGQACLAAYFGLAGCLVGSNPLVRMVASAAELMQNEPFVSLFASFDENSKIEATGLRPGVALCADGNPLKVLTRDDRVAIGVRRHCTVAVRLVHEEVFR